jgi:hypothetical protein
MKKIISLTIFFTFLLIISVSAQIEGDDCLNNDDCNSDICQGGECRTEDIMDVIELAQLEEGSEDDDLDLGAELCLENWTCTAWGPCTGATQTRTCSDINNCLNTPILIPKPQTSQTCLNLPQATCNDGIRNQGEVEIDCGGPCNPCKSCYDDMKNCHDGGCETGVDCGGPCDVCILKDANESSSFWIIFISILLIAILLMIGYWYFKLKKDAEKIGVNVTNMTRPQNRGRRPPTQPSSLLRI